MSGSGVQIRVRGKVQGVGFRPFVWQLATRLGLCGTVSNDGAGVLIHLTLPSPALLNALRAECPPLARIDSVSTCGWEYLDSPEGFTIVASGSGAMSTQIVPDAATCPACLSEMTAPDNPRYRYPFINCTHCGPRMTIIRAMPYDRLSTAMAAFPLCPACERDYRDPRDRRFHAQPVACAKCGPWLSWVSSHAHVPFEREAALKAAINALKKGDIVAIKGLGGFHLACLAGDDAAVARLRLRKRRPGKPLAVMMPMSVRGQVSEASWRLLSSPAAPIVLVPFDSAYGLSAAIAPGLDEVGLMLPANPLQHLLMEAINAPMVMTSANVSGRPPVLTDREALTDLAGIADGWLLHNREIVQRMDDSVVRADGEMLRRSRGYVPDVFALPPGFSGLPPILGMGADLKNTFCMARGDSAVVSQHFGDLSDEGVQKQWQKMQALMCQIYDFSPQRVVIDAHPGYSASRTGREFCAAPDVVLHHHAHAAACMAEHGWPLEGGTLLALTLDGIGWGANGALWGGELLKVNYQTCERLGGLPAVALPGGDRAAREPWRNLLAQGLAFVKNWSDYPEFNVVSRRSWQPLERAIARGINAPQASSAGRLFDALAAALGLLEEAQSYEGEAACRLETLARQGEGAVHPVRMPLYDNLLDLSAFWQSWLNWPATPEARAYAFHDALAAGLAALVEKYRYQAEGATIVCAGGVWHNRLLRERLQHYLTDMTLWFPHQYPAGDGAISLGQTLIAAARILN